LRSKLKPLYIIKLKKHIPRERETGKREIKIGVLRFKI
jgi:hypothetical protein